MKHLINFLKGICIGIANVIPGFSGGTMAVMLKVYDLFVYIFANIFQEFKNVIKKTWSLILGIVVGILIALVVIVKLLELIPFIMVMFFVGLIIGSIPSIYKKASKGKIKIADLISFIVAIAIMVILPLIQTNNSESITYSVPLFIIIFILGVVSSSAMVIPGVSGSLVLMAFGYYAFIMTTIKDFLLNIFNFSFTNYWGMFGIIVCFALGFIIGIVLISKLISKLMQKYPKTVYCAILGLLVASIYSIIFTTFNEYTITLNAPTIILSIISLGIGILIVLFGNKISNKNKDN